MRRATNAARARAAALAGAALLSACASAQSPDDPAVCAAYSAGRSHVEVVADGTVSRVLGVQPGRVSSHEGFLMRLAILRRHSEGAPPNPAVGQIALKCTRVEGRGKKAEAHRALHAASRSVTARAAAMRPARPEIALTGSAPLPQRYSPGTAVRTRAP